jgi:hypothetical protein
VLEDAFGIPLVIRYMLEVCATVGEARVVLARLPVHQAYNLTLVNRSGAVLTAYPAPDRGAIFRPFPAATNHQDVVEWPEHARDTRTIEGQRYILGLLENPATTPAGLVAAFGQPPLYSTAYARHRDTLCTAPADGGPGGVPLARLCVDAVDAVVRGVRRGNSCSGVCRGPGRAARMVVPAGAVPLPGAR